MANIKSAVSIMEEAKVALDDLDLGHVRKRLHRRLHRAKKCLNSAWDQTQSASLANVGIALAMPA